MKSLYKLTDKNKSTYFSLRIHDIGEEITKRSTQWFNEVFFTKSIYIDEETYTNNLLLDLNYMFTQALWLIKLAKKEKLNVKDAKHHIQNLYNYYSCKNGFGLKKNGYRMLVNDERYNAFEHRLWTEEEIKINKEKSSAVVKKIWAELEAKEKKAK